MSVRAGLWVLLVAGVLLTGCLTPLQDVREGEIGFETLAQGQDSAITSEQAIVVRDQHALVQLWNEHAPGETAPDVDFQRRMVVAVFAGEKADTCHHVEVTNVTGQGDHVRVEAHHLSLEGGACAEQIVYPFHIVEVQRHDARVVFDVGQETRPVDGDAG